DLDNGSITNTATASGNGTTSPPATAKVTAEQNPALTLTKTASPQIGRASCRERTYTYVVTNTGNGTMAGPFSHTDDKQGKFSCGTGPLTRGATTSCTPTCTIPQADLDNGSITNTATASGNGTTSPPATAKVTAEQNPALTLTKTASP